MSTVTLWLLIVTVGAGTVALRFSFFYLFGTMEMPPRLVRALRFVPAAVLAALVVPALVYSDGALALHAGNARLVAGTLAAVVAWTTHSVVWTIASGMATLWVLTALS